ncbi:polyprenyl synthetase family protein [Convivina intestini]|uniref:Geranylgeranyl diphosphate synthase type II n=1 Tax=Convivina intestini TaxID=1505726 RepID=A0A2U1DCD4_9LACO|nr:polyprenyl synthetase family protein [Convivina intestini]PVY85320.1 geranylgeranyl diphosphate synthase type II [Convivina intestini]CAH1852853.1 hypothetical protein R077811_00538 [Convivina intestini]SDB86369.1 geranylgeranyl diphosphate synthase, type II [Leuconostocaceae bacterium R-53105]
MNKFSQFSQEWQPKINQKLTDDLALIAPSSNNAEMAPMLAYALLNGGKRLRPLLTLAVLQSFQAKISSDDLRIATMVEWVHSYSLVHDDLPAMDNDQYRRGQLSVHAKFGHANGILVGDALLTAAFQVGTLATSINPKRLFKVINSLALRAGVTGMVGGQFYDMQNHQGQVITKEWLLDKVYQPKTAALISHALLAGGYLLDLSAADCDLLRQYGENFGLAFQIQDDLDDYQQDADEEITSLPHLIGLTATQSVKANLLSDARFCLKKLGQGHLNFNAELLDQFLQQLENK